jgi:arginase
VSLQAILVPYALGKPRVAGGAGPEALLAAGVLNGLPIGSVTTIEVEPSAGNEIKQSIAVDAAVAQAARLLRQAGDLPIVLSGNCHACLGTLTAAGPEAAIIWLDAHGDLNTPDTTETGYFDGMALATALGWTWTRMTRTIPGFAVADERRVLLVGARDLDSGERARLAQSQVRHYAPPPLGDTDRDTDFDDALAHLPEAPHAYVHLDLDVLDPSELAVNQFGVGGGVSARWLEAALRSVRRRFAIAAVGVSAYDPAYAAPAVAAPLVNRLLKALLA